MPRFVIILILTFLILPSIFAQEPSPTPTTLLPEPAQSMQGEGARLDVFFGSLKQGRVGLIRITGQDISTVSATAFEPPIPLFSLAENEFYGFVVPSMSQAARAYELVVTVEHGSGFIETLRARVDVLDGGFIQQDVMLVEEKIRALLDRDIEDAELARLFELARPFDPQPLWSATGFIFPVNRELTSPFGASRTFNGLYETIHTGWDFQATTIGTPLVASASGQVAFAGAFPIRGNYVMVNHGVGVYSGYAHLSVIYVTQGEYVTQGQVLGLVGSTGRSSSAHAHIEFIVDNKWVDAADFINMDLP